MENILKTKVQLRRGTEESIKEQEESLVLLDGEVFLEYLADGTVKMKAGNGSSVYKDLHYISSDSIE